MIKTISLLIRAVCFLILCMMCLPMIAMSLDARLWFNMRLADLRRDVHDAINNESQQRKSK